MCQTIGDWDSLKKDLLAGEQLSLDLKRIDAAYLDQNKREYELTRHISLRQLNPLALLSLKATSTCEIALPEWLFDLDNPGHYMRRLKNVSLSIPSVTGPYTSVNCTLSLLKSTVRKSSLLDNDEYARQDNEDDRFSDTFGTIQSIVTSSGNADSGMFETNLRDERYLPFEGAGAESTWRLELPAAFRQFDYNIISDVILHVRYTARSGGSLLAGGGNRPSPNPRWPGQPIRPVTAAQPEARLFYRVAAVPGRKRQLHRHGEARLLPVLHTG